MEFTEVEYRTARSVAETHYRINKGYIDKEDILSAVYLWMAQHAGSVEELRNIDDGKGILRQELYRAGQRFTYEERLRRTGSQPGDIHFYTQGQVEELLPAVWSYEDWTMVSDSPSYVSSSTGGDPAEGNNRLAMLVDVKGALWSLRADDIALLFDRYKAGLTYEQIGTSMNLSEDAARGRVNRAMNRLIRQLGGEPPWWRAGDRKVRSNASAQSELREN